MRRTDDTKHKMDRVRQTHPADECDFCDEISGGASNRFHAVYGEELGSRVIAATSDFAVLPSMGQIVPGYLLIIPMTHAVSLAKIGPESLTRLELLLREIARILSHHYAPPVLFEHGLRETGSGGGCGVEHAHLHVVPFASETALINTSGWTTLAALSDLTRFGGVSYLLYGDTSGVSISAVDGIPSQFLRRALAEAVGQERWDWRRELREAQLVETLITLRSAWAVANTIPSVAPTDG